VNVRMFLIVCSVLLMFHSPARQQTWRSADGLHSFQGEFVRLSRNTVTLRGADGVEIEVPLARLDEESQTRARSANLLPEQRRNLLFLHETDRYRLTLHSDNNLMRFQLLEDGQEVVHPVIQLQLRNFVMQGGRRVMHGFRTMEAPPSRDGNTVTWRARMQNEVVVEIEIELGDEGVEIGYRRVLPGGFRGDAGIWVTVHVPGWLDWNEETRRLHGPMAPDGITHEQIPEFFRDFRVQHRTHENRRLQDLSFIDTYNDHIFGLSFLRLSGPYSSRSVEITGPRRQEQGHMVLLFYEGGRPLYTRTRVGLTYPEGPDHTRIPGRFGLHFR
jgi:hypothetical protein